MPLSQRQMMERQRKGSKNYLQSENENVKCSGKETCRTTVLVTTANLHSPNRNHPAVFHSCVCVSKHNGLTVNTHKDLRRVKCSNNIVEFCHTAKETVDTECLFYPSSQPPVIDFNCVLIWTE